jgi:hypothetical protein
MAVQLLECDEAALPDELENHLFAFGCVHGRPLV